jgi:predicted kinase
MDLPRPALLILTGASHSGKSSVIEALSRTSAEPLALLGVDAVLAGTIRPAADDRWDQIPLAYDLIEAQTPVLLDRGWPVLVESTFTYVGDDSSGEIHLDRLETLVGIAARREVPWLVCQLDAKPQVLISRARVSNRLEERIVSETARLHLTASLPVEAHRLRSDLLRPEEIAQQLIRLLDSARR